ncbi:MAG: glycerol-3-phosphate acyltransferase [Proteobacteria bacterium]|nr:glycerol-3-phosphate acyltransferase [Pseudomonadota bacterium]
MMVVFQTETSGDKPRIYMSWLRCNCKAKHYHFDQFLRYLGNLMSDIGTGFTVIVVAVGVYLVGSVNTSIVAGRILRIQHMLKAGSGNPGATNLFRAAGWQIAVPVLLVDLGKAFGAIWAARLVGPPEFAPFALFPLLIGNLYPIFHGFRGGKGVAAVVGGFLAIEPIVMLLGGCFFFIVFGISRIVSLGSILMVASYSVWIWLINGSFAALSTGIGAACIIVFTHRANISRIIRGQEPKLGVKNEVNQ